MTLSGNRLLVFFPPKVGKRIMSLADRLGLAGLVLGLLAIAAPYLWPDRKWIGWLSLSAAIVLTVMWGWLEIRPRASAFYLTHPVKSTFAVFMLGGILAVGVWLLVMRGNIESKRVAPVPPARLAEGGAVHDPLTHFDDIPADKLTLHDLFIYDFSHENNTNKVGGGWTLAANKTGAKLRVTYFVIFKMDSNSKHLQFFVPFTQDIYNVCVDLSAFYPKALKEANEFGITGKGRAGDSTLNNSKEAVFTGRIFIYSEADLASEELGKLTTFYKSKNLKLQFRSNDYLEHEKLSQKLKQTKP
jgi:hypothetical protein